MSFILKRFNSTSSLSSPSLIGKTAVVTGGSRGLGLHIAKKLSEQGASIILVSRQKDVLRHNLKHELSIISNNQEHGYIQCDLSDTGSIYETFLSANQLKKASILINCAGVSQNSLLFSTPSSLVSKIIDTNLTSSIILSQILLKQLMKNSPSSIINISSVLGLKGFKGTSVYSASKAGIVGFTRALAVEMGSKKIRVNSISPGLIKETEMGKGLHYDNALQKEGVPLNDISNTVLYLLENESITGQNIVVDNGIVI
ncbi:3-oxoacyl-[acyl-carrier-protein] reductase [Wickerhamomyces ciferrii]|uniref:3-oxoacyl-[acyl-carrier-protein] reductase n=1 Tax=Wickerhamomyces ciferrii (strain ATCC 14091 / BCRC 22168 / CBS 111 / JCM 3599 / NBRC 0793 / NRRL Y-1031 F-60-10) TaxID=1206466 RepID=K0KXV5_WICCF|nr:3-oxoacyl-[acyl-carrier-protein] reductase [Wickerhamomyces ciferrii]CCH46269.1 3-oxoacyl-[acyl-carrier-protein] reductase [Wickerhamomyces ciferrii]